MKKSPAHCTVCGLFRGRDGPSHFKCSKILQKRHRDQSTQAAFHKPVKTKPVDLK